MSEKNLSIYLNDHLGGAVGAVGLLDRLRAQVDDRHMARVLEELLEAVRQDQRTLEDLIRRLDLSESTFRKLAGAVGQKLSTLKLRLEASHHGDLQLLHALDSLTLGIEGKKALWTALGAAAEEEPELRLADYEALTARADEQLASLQELRAETAREALPRA